MIEEQSVVADENGHVVTVVGHRDVDGAREYLVHNAWADTYHYVSEEFLRRAASLSNDKS